MGWLSLSFRRGGLCVAPVGDGSLDDVRKVGSYMGVVLNFKAKDLCLRSTPVMGFHNFYLTKNSKLFLVVYFIYFILSGQKSPTKKLIIDGRYYLKLQLMTNIL